MNCKPGDLAVIVGASIAREHVGKVVRCVRYVEFDGPAWEIDPRLPNMRTGNEYWCVADHRLRPIRPDGITDEEVRDLYLPKPVKEFA